MLVSSSTLNCIKLNRQSTKSQVKKCCEIHAQLEAQLASFSSETIIVYGPVTETLHPPGDFWRPLFLETLAIGLLKSGCLQKSQCWIKPWGRFFFQNGHQISTNVLLLVLFFCISTILIQFNEI